MAYRKDWRQPQTGNQGFVGTVKTLGRRVIVLPPTTGRSMSLVCSPSRLASLLPAS